MYIWVYKIYINTNVDPYIHIYIYMYIRKIQSMKLRKTCVVFHVQENRELLNALFRWNLDYELCIWSPLGFTRGVRKLLLRNSEITEISSFGCKSKHVFFLLLFLSSRPQQTIEEILAEISVRVWKGGFLVETPRHSNLGPIFDLRLCNHVYIYIYIHIHIQSRMLNQKQ